MAGEVAGDTSSASGKIKEQCCVDTSPFHDLPNGGSVDCNGVKFEAGVEGTENGNGKEEADRTYVFVNGSDSVAEGGDNGNFTKWALVEKSAENDGELKLNSGTDVGGSKVNGSSGHCSDEKVAAISDVAVKSENGKDTSDENGDRGMERANLLSAEDSKGESNESGPVQEVDGVNSAESVSLGVANCQKEFEMESSFEVVERIPESPEVRGDAKCSNDCKEVMKDSKELPEQVMSTSDIVKEVSESHDFNDKETEGPGDLKEPVENTAVLSEKVECTCEVTAVLSEKAECSSEDAAMLSEKLECTSEVVQMVSESLRDANGPDDAKESLKITEQLPLQVECNSEVVEEVPNSNSVSHVHAGHSFDCKGSFEHAVDLPVQVESSDIVEGIPESQAVSLGDSEVTVDCKEQSEDTVEETVMLSKQVGENQNELVNTDTNVSEPAIGDSVEEQVAEERKSDPIKEEKVEESRQLDSSADVQENQERVEINAKCVNNDVEQEDLVEVAAESSPIDQLSNAKGDHDQIAESFVCFGPSNTDAASTKSPTDNSQSLETSAMPDQICITNGNGDSDDASLGMSDQNAALASAEVLASSADCSNMPVESAECPPVAKETIVALDADIAERSLAVDDDISSPALDDGEPPAELEVVNDAEEPILEVELGEAEATSSAYAEAESGARDGVMATNNISTSLHATKPAEIQICFGSIGHKELSSLSIGGRSSEPKPSVDAALSDPSPDLESPENDDNNISTSQGTEVFYSVPQSDEVSPIEASIVGVAEAKLVVPEVESRFFNYLVRLPRYDGELTTQIKDAQAQVDEKTLVRDAIKAEIQMIKVCMHFLSF